MNMDLCLYILFLRVKNMVIIHIWKFFIFMYVSYECYKDIKVQFGEKIKREGYSITDGVKTFEETYDQVKLQNLKQLSNVFDNLKKYLSNNHVFVYGSYDGEGTCKYISYLLCEQIHEKNPGECDEETFKMLKDFVDTYNKTNRSYMCSNHVKRLDNHEFQKMKALYDLYDKYTPLSKVYTNWDNNNCSDISYLVYLYNAFLRNYKSDSLKFNTILTDFQGLMKNIVLKATPHCSGKDLAVGNPVLFEEPKVIVPPPTPERENKKSQVGTLDETGKSKHSVVTGLPTSSVSEARENSHNAKGPQESDPLRIRTSLDSHKSGEAAHPYNTLEPSEKDNPFGIIGSYVSHGYHLPWRSDRSHDYLDTNLTLSEREDNFKSTLLKEQGLGIEDASVLGKMKTALSTMVESVEPAPILVVSGGMGALFLLFKVLKIKFKKFLILYPHVNIKFK
ncbi:hypothetical protein PVNG_06213 [Plasmodium vivax North Korean]|uniref:Uncharacterized protein n=1 Tax=Plasmodium vivax North Korean TaxID=1035514 RepID=A0A0J9U193_PLAVI|nr:hypothetical protein PVNG_06213 [Plasmodium vivax North Korean]